MQKLQWLIEQVNANKAAGEGDRGIDTPDFGDTSAGSNEAGKWVTVHLVTSLRMLYDATLCVVIATYNRRSASNTNTFIQWCCVNKQETSLYKDLPDEGTCVQHR